jgi:regulator of replication initiation timing
MNLEKASAERDSLLQALKRAEEEIARVRAGQQQAEARLAEMRTRSGATMPVRNDGSQLAIAQALSAQKRAETTARTLEEQLRGQQAEQEQLRAALQDLRAENAALREQNEDLMQRQKEGEEPDTQATTQSDRQAQKALREELDAAWAEIQRLRTLVVKVASDARKKGLNPEIPLKAQDPRIAPGPSKSVPPAPASRATPPASAARPAPSAKATSPAPSTRSKTEVDSGPKSGAQRAA